jgi:2-aminoadipate transaminase
MRLNFAGVPEGDIREGMRRIGKVVREQVSLFGTLAGSPARPQGGASEAPAGTAAAPEEGGERTGLADVVELPRREREGAGRRRRDR